MLSDELDGDMLISYNLVFVKFGFVIKEKKINVL